VLKGDSTRDLGAAYIAISRLPWLTALAARPTSGTWTRGAHRPLPSRLLMTGQPSANPLTGAH